MSAQITRRTFLAMATAASAALFVPPLAERLFTSNNPQAGPLYDRIESFYYKSALHKPGTSSCGDPTGHYQTFQRLPFAEIAAELGLDKRASILYPGAGAHLAALEIGNGFATLPRPVSDIHYVFTEHESEGMDGVTEKRFELLMDVAKPELQILGKREVGSVSRYDVDYDLRVFGNPVTLTYAINAPTNHDRHTFFTDQQVFDADVVVFHDALTANDDQLALGVVLVAKMAAESRSKKALIFEDIARVTDGKSDSAVYDLLPGRTVLVSGEYGCHNEGCDNLYGYRGALVYFPDVDLLQTPEGIQRLEQLPHLNYCRGARPNINDRIRRPNGGVVFIV